MLAYAATLTPDEEDGGYVVTFRELAKGITQGETLEDAVRKAADALAVALEFYAERKQRFPSSSMPRPDEYLITALHRDRASVAKRRRVVGSGRGDGRPIDRKRRSR